MRFRLVRLSAAVLCAAAMLSAAPVAPQGLRDPAWSPDGKHIAASWFDRIWTFAPDGRQAAPLVKSGSRGVERDPAWSRDGARVAFAADRGDGFDLYVSPLKGGAPQRVTMMAGDERWPSWTPDGRLVFAHRDRTPGAADSGMTAQRAVKAPRFLIGRDPADPAGTGERMQIEDRIPRATLDDLISRGHVFQKIGRKGAVRYGYASAVVIDAKTHTVEGGAEPRRSHAAVASR